MAFPSPDQIHNEKWLALNQFAEATSAATTSLMCKKFPTNYKRMIAGHENSGKTSFIKTYYHTADIKHIHLNDDRIVSSLDEASLLSFVPDDVKIPTPIEARIEYASSVGSDRVLLRLIDTPGKPSTFSYRKA